MDAGGGCGATYRQARCAPPPQQPLPSSDQKDDEKEGTSSSTSTSTSPPSPPSMSLKSALKNKDTLFSMPQLQVCDVSTTSIVGIVVSNNTRSISIHINVFIRRLVDTTSSLLLVVLVAACYF